MRVLVSGGVMLAAMLVALAACSPVTVLNGVARGPFTVTHNIAYAPNPRESLDVYKPAHAYNAPVVVFYYGGSWQDGDKAMYRFVGAALASKGVLTIIPNYRVYPQAVFPGFLKDSAAAFAWAHAHAADYGGNPGRMFVMGHSAGAYNAAMLALDPQWLAPFGLSPHRDIAGFIGLAGPYDFLPLTDPVLKTIFGPPDELARTQPINFVSPGAPPAFLAAGTADHTVSPGNTTRLAKRLAQAGDCVTVKLYPGINHTKLIGAFSPLLRWMAPVFQDSLAFIHHTPPKQRSGP
ncbi:MAG: alpha/beta hydrolase [Rhodospirillales bacterium]|nr:alpha/beta hydrolase [Rhodospirillales bacterium]MDE2319789.1 alpha/beta hydrolase [Rhodospirillales bacterium]